MKDKLVLGCGSNFLGEDWMHLDISDLEHVDEVHDLQTGYLPFEDNSFQKVRARHVLEHIPEGRAIDILQEISRVSKSGAVVEIVLPHFLSWNSQDLDHHWSGSRRTFVQFCEGYEMNSPYPTLFRETNVVYRFEDSRLYGFARKFWSDEKVAQILPNAVREIEFNFEVVYRD